MAESPYPLDTAKADMHDSTVTKEMYEAGLAYLHRRGTAWCVSDLFKAMLTAKSWSGEIGTLVNHEQDPHCCGCWVVRYDRDGLNAVCNECGEKRDLVGLLDAPRSEKSESEQKEAARWADRLNWIHARYEVDGSGTESGDPLDVIEAEIKQALDREGCQRVTAFANAVLHGDEQHKTWLRDAAQCFNDGLPLPEKK